MPPRLRTLTALLLAAGAYYLLARLGLMLALAQSNASAIWPPSGFALVLLLRFGRNLWPAVFAGAFLANLAVFHNNHAASLPVLLAASSAIAVGNTGEALLAQWMLQRLGIAAVRLDTQREVYKFGGVVALAALVSALAGVLVVVCWNMAEKREFWRLLGYSREMTVLLATFAFTLLRDLTYGIVMGCALAALFALLHKAVHEEGD